jgi:hypothetical protein
MNWYKQAKQAPYQIAVRSEWELSVYWSTPTLYVYEASPDRQAYIKSLEEHKNTKAAVKEIKSLKLLRKIDTTTGKVEYSKSPEEEKEQMISDLPSQKELWGW